MDAHELSEYFAKLRSGDKEAFTHIYAELKQPVFTIACRIVQSREVAEDITHDVFVKLFLAPPDSSVRNSRAWVFQMTRNLAIDTLRKKPCVDVDELALPVEDGSTAVIAQMDMEAAFGRLTEEERQVVTLHLNGDLTFREIGAILGTSLPSTYRTYRRALKALRNYLDGGAI